MEAQLAQARDISLTVANFASGVIRGAPHNQIPSTDNQFLVTTASNFASTSAREGSQINKMGRSDDQRRRLMDKAKEAVFLFFNLYL
jgi:hypothetical protein